MKELRSNVDFMLSTTPEKHDINPLIEWPTRDSTLCIVGALEPMAGVDNSAVAFHRKRVPGSLIGNLADTQEVLDFCAQHGIGPDIEIINIQEVNEAYKKGRKGCRAVPLRHRIGFNQAPRRRLGKV